MENALVLAKVIGPVYLLLGLSILLYVKPWEKVMAKWEEDHLPMITLMIMYAILGAIVINMYNVWEWNIWLLVTLTGWILAVKSVAFFLLPGSVIRKCLALKKKPEMLYLAGVIGVVIGAVLSYYTYLV